MSRQRLDEHRAIWKEKPVLRAIYTDFYQRIIAASRPGRSLEIGGGSGNLKEFSAEVVSTDIVYTSWLDATADAQALPFVNSSFANLVAVDVLHHVERPRRFFQEAVRVLQPEGRLILLEPAITPVSRFFYTYFHPEPVEMDADPLGDDPHDPSRSAFDANQAIPTLLFGRHRERFAEAFPMLKVVLFEQVSLLAYPLSGGFRRWGIVPAATVGRLLRLERMLAPKLGWLMAFRLFVVVEKRRELVDGER